MSLLHLYRVFPFSFRTLYKGHLRCLLNAVILVIKSYPRTIPLTHFVEGQDMYVRIWNASLSQTEVAGIMNRADTLIPGKTLLARYSFNGGSLADDKGVPAQAAWSSISRPKSLLHRSINQRQDRLRRLLLYLNRQALRVPGLSLTSFRCCLLQAVPKFNHRAIARP